MSQKYQVTGELTDPQLVKLDQPIPLAAGKVQLVVTRLADRPAIDLVAFENESRRRQAARNHIARTILALKA
jgi:hypothetical protein